MTLALHFCSSRRAGAVMFVLGGHLRRAAVLRPQPKRFNRKEHKERTEGNQNS